MTLMTTIIVLAIFYGSGAIYCYTDGYCKDRSGPIKTCYEFEYDEQLQRQKQVEVPCQE